MKNNEKTGLNKLFFKDKRIKLMSFLLAGLTWYAVKGAMSQSTVVLDIPIRIQTRDGVAVLSQSVRSATVVFRGSQEATAQLQDIAIRAPIEITVPAKSRKPSGVEKVPLRPRYVTGARDVRPIRINHPSDIVFQLDEEAIKDIPVRAVYFGRPASGQLVSVTCDPDKVRVRGPRQSVDAIGVLLTEKMDLDFAVDTFSSAVQINTPSGSGSLSITPSSVTATIVIEHDATSRRISDLPVSAIVKPGMLVSSIKPAAVSVAISGSKRALDKLQAGDLRVLADCGSASRDTEAEFPLTVHLPPDVELFAVADPGKVRVQLRRAD